MWRYVGTSPDERSFFIDGVNIWAFSWKCVEDEHAQIEDPSYHQAFTFDVYTVTDGNRTVKFAAGEFSNGIWGFYVPS